MANDPNPSPAAAHAGRILRRDLGAWIESQRAAGLSEREIEKSLNGRLGGELTISRQTFARWYPKENADRPQEKEPAETAPADPRAADPR